MDVVDNDREVMCIEHLHIAAFETIDSKLEVQMTRVLDSVVATSRCRFLPTRSSTYRWPSGRASSAPEPTPDPHFFLRTLLRVEIGTAFLDERREGSAVPLIHEGGLAGR